MRVLLITNYRSDKQKSMLRFGELLASGITKHNLVVSEEFPRSKLQKFCFGSKLSKWAGYLDKYFIFGKRIKSLFKNNSYDLIHIIDHSNSVYLPKLTKFSQSPKLTTCHDLIAIRSASGEFQHAPITSKKGKRLQSWIEKSLAYSDFYACDSLQTQSDLVKKIPQSRTKSKVIHLGVEKPNSQNFDYNQTIGFDLLTNKYVLHVGSDAWYKNRKGVLESFKFTCEKQANLVQKLVFVGPKFKAHELDPPLENWVKRNKDKIIFLPNVSELTLQALYNKACFLIFPSFIEGFGWPPLEAYVNNCYSITTKTGAIFEILNDNALFIDPNNQKELNTHVFNNLTNSSNRLFNKLIPTNKECVNKYAHLYEKIVQNNY